MEDFLSPESRSSGVLRLLGPPGPPLGNIHLVPSRPQPCRLVTMTSVVKTVYLQPPSVLSSGLLAGGCHAAPAPGRCELAPGGQARSMGDKIGGSEWRAPAREGVLSALTTC